MAELVEVVGVELLDEGNRLAWTPLRLVFSLLPLTFVPVVFFPPV